MTVEHFFFILFKRGKQISFSANQNVFSSPHSFSKVMAVDCYDTPVPRFHPTVDNAHLIIMFPIFLKSQDYLLLLLDFEILQ